MRGKQLKIKTGEEVCVCVKETLKKSSPNDHTSNFVYCHHLNHIQPTDRVGSGAPPFHLYSS